MLERHSFMTRLAGLGVILMVATSCSSSPEENVSQACEASSTYETALQNFQDTLTPDATVEQIRTAREEVSSSHDELVEESEDVVEDRVEELRSAEEDLGEAVDALPDEATVPQAIDALKDNVNSVESARNNVESELNC